MSLKKKLKKIGKAAVMAGAAYGASKMLGPKSSGFLSSGAAGGQRLPKGDAFARARKLMTSNEAVKGVRSPMKKPSFSKRVMDAVNVYRKKGLDTGRGPGIKRTDSLADKVLSGNVMGLTDMGGAKYGKMIEAKNGKYVKAPCKLGRNKKTLIT
jgi:hypothetical protein|tara:strand:- start:11 stop:472 length:462 start_codon:yes stop_codon:yes gene_type:complete